MSLTIVISFFETNFLSPAGFEKYLGALGYKIVKRQVMPATEVLQRNGRPTIIISARKTQ